MREPLLWRHEVPDVLSDPDYQQHPEEIAWLCERVRGCRSVLEVGSCMGHTLRRVAEVMAPGALICAIDLGVLPKEGGPTFEGFKTEPFLRQVIGDLCDGGFDARVFFGDSHSEDAIRWARGLGLFDLVFIDAGHSYEDVLADWRAYGPLGRMVAFHDVANCDLGVARLWDEIMRDCPDDKEMIDAGANKGIGLIRRIGWVETAFDDRE